MASFILLLLFRFGFVKFATEADVKASLDMVGGPGGTLHLDGRDVRVNHAYSKEQKRSGQCSTLHRILSLDYIFVVLFKKKFAKGFICE